MTHKYADFQKQTPTARFDLNLLKSYRLGCHYPEIADVSSLHKLPGLLGRLYNDIRIFLGSQIPAVLDD